MPAARCRHRRLQAVLVAGALLVALTACGTDGPPAGLRAIGAGLHGPAGTTASRGPVHVAALDFDPQGRLWLGTAAYTDAGTDTVSLLPRSGATPVVVLRHLHTVLGLLWYRGELYVSSHARVDAYGGLRGHTFTRHRTVVRFPDAVGEGNGLAVGPDGRISLGITSPCDHCRPTLADSAAVVSFRPDGHDLRVDARRLRAPVGLAYDPGTANLLVSVNQRDDLGAKTPGDVLVVVRRGQDWRFPSWGSQGGSACTGVPRPVARLDRHAAVSGVAVVHGTLGPTVGRVALVTEWATGTVLEVSLRPVGSDYAGTASPFLTGIVHPVAIARAADGSVVVDDWQTGHLDRIRRSSTS